MRARTIALFAVAILLAGGTAILARSWLAQRATVAQAAPAVQAVPARSVLVAAKVIPRGHILKPEDFSWQPWPQGRIDPAYIQQGTKPRSAFAGWVARQPFAPGEPITTAKIVAPGNRGFLAAVLRPGMRAVSVRVNATSGISGFVFPGDHVDLLLTQVVPPAPGAPNKMSHKAAATILHNMRVLAINQSLSGKEGHPEIAHTATLEVTPKQSQIIAVASVMGKLSMSLRSLAGPSKKTADSTKLGNRVTYTLDDEVSPLLPKAFARKGNRNAGTITILRGNGKSEKAAVSQPPSRGA